MRHALSSLWVLAAITGVVLLVGRFAIADDPKADLGSSHSAYQIYDSILAGPDHLHVKADRVIKATGPCFSAPMDGIEIELKTPIEEGLDIYAAIATGRAASETVWYEVAGHYLQAVGLGYATQSTHWTAEFDSPEIEILDVPSYIFADARAAVPIKFRVTRLDGNCRLDVVRVSFLLDSDHKWTYKGTATFTDANGWSKAGEDRKFGNGTTDTYTVWVPMTESTFLHASCNLQDDVSRDAKFMVYVEGQAMGKVNHPTGYFKTSSYLDQAACAAKSFADKDFNAVSIGVKTGSYYGKKFAVKGALDVYREEELVSKQANSRIDHNHTVRDEGETNCTSWFATPHSFANCGYMWDGQVVRFDNLGQVGWDNNSSIWTADRGTDYIRTRARLYDPMFFSGLLYDWAMRIKVTGETVGAYYGVSYGQDPVPVLKLAPGLDTKHKEDGGGGVVFAETAKGSIIIESVGDEKNLGLTLAEAALNLVVSIHFDDWAAWTDVAEGVLGSAMDIGTPFGDDSAQASIVGVKIRGALNGENLLVPLSWNPYSAIANGVPVPIDAPMNETTVYLIAGETWMFYTSCSAGCASYPAWHSDWELVSAEAKYALGGGKHFTDGDVCRVVTTPNN